MVRLFIRVFEHSSNEPEPDDEIMNEAEANAHIRVYGTKDIFELVPIKTDVRQVKQEVIV